MGQAARTGRAWLIAPLQGKQAAFRPGNGAVICLNETAAFIYGLLDSKHSRDQIIGLLMQKYDILDCETAQDDLDAMLQEMREADLIGGDLDAGRPGDRRGEVDRMTKRTYVKPEWHAMGMPIAEAACGRGDADFHTEGYCLGGGTAVATCTQGKWPLTPPTQCTSGDGDGNFCRTGTSGTPGTDCSGGSWAVQ